MTLSRPLFAAALAATLLVGLAAHADEAAVSFEPGAPKLADVLAKAKATGKPAFIDFTVDNAWCRKLAADTFSQPAVAEVMKGFVNVHVEGEKGEGPELVKRYGVRIYPTLVVVDASGDEIDRIVGYRAPSLFIPEMKRIASGKGTIPELKKRAAAAPENLSIAAELGVRLTVANPQATIDLLKSLLAKAKAGDDRNTEAKIRLEYADALLRKGDAKAAAAEGEVLVRDFADSPAAGEAAGRLRNAILALDAGRATAFVEAARLATQDDKDRVAVEQLAFAVHKKGIADALKNRAAIAGDDAQKLNGVAWDCFEQRVNIPEALGWSRRAVEKAPDDPNLLDTLANLLWITNARDEAMKVEADAVAKAEGSLKRDLEIVLARWRAELAVTQQPDAPK